MQVEQFLPQFPHKNEAQVVAVLEELEVLAQVQRLAQWELQAVVLVGQQRASVLRRILPQLVIQFQGASGREVRCL